MDVVGGARLVGVDEDQVERSPSFLLEERQGVDGAADPYLDPVGEPGPLEVAASDLGVAGLELEAQEPPARGKGAPEPDRAVTAEGADLEDLAGARHLCQQLQEPALDGGHVDRRQPGRPAVRERLLEGGIGRQQQPGEVLVNGCPLLDSHRGEG